MNRSTNLLVCRPCQVWPICLHQHKTAYTPICDGLQFQSKIRVGLLLGVNSKRLASSIIYVSYYSTLITIIQHPKYSDIQKATLGSNWTAALQYKMPIRKSMEYSHKSGQRNWSYYIHVYDQHPNRERNAVNKSFINLCLKEHLNVLASASLLHLFLIIKLSTRDICTCLGPPLTQLSELLVAQLSIR